MLPFVILFVDKNVRIGGLVSRSSIFHLQIRHHAKSLHSRRKTLAKGLNVLTCLPFLCIYLLD